MAVTINTVLPDYPAMKEAALQRIVDRISVALIEHGDKMFSSPCHVTMEFGEYVHEEEIVAIYASVGFTVTRYNGTYQSEGGWRITL